MNLTELSEPQILVIYPGRFQPFHKGHHAVFNWLSTKFGRNNVVIATSDKVDPPKSPFTFSEKAYFMHLTGVPTDRIVQSASPYDAGKVIAGGNLNIPDPTNCVVLFAVSEKDMSEDPRFKNFSKKDGTPTYFQPFRNMRDTEDMTKHGYILTVPTFDFTVLGKPMRSGTELRSMYEQADEKTRQAIIKDLFGKYTHEAEHLMTSKLAPIATPGTDVATTPRKTKLPAAQKPEGGMKVKAAAKKANKLVKEAVLPTDTPPGTAPQTVPQTATASQAQTTNTPQAKQASQALQKGLARYQQLYPNTDHGFITRFIDHIEPDGTIVVAGDNSTGKIKALLAQGGGAQIRVVNQDELQIAQQRPQVRTMQEMGGVGVVSSGKNKQTNFGTVGDQNDVTGNTLGQEMKAFGLIGRANPGANRQQKNVNRNIGKGVNESEEIRQQMAKFQHQLIDMANDEMDRIKERMANEHDPVMLQHYKQRLQKQRDKILRIMNPGA